MSRRWALATAGIAVAMAIAGCSTLSGGRPVGAAQPIASPAARAPQRVTLADDGRTLTLPVGGTFLLDLGGPPPAWQVQVDDTAVLARVPNVLVIRGAQGIYRAKAPGAARLTADGGGHVFRITVVVSAR